MCVNRSGKLPCLVTLALLITPHFAFAITQDAGAKKTDQDQPVRLKTELVELRAVVTDKKGKPIDDLKKEDFEVLENGAPQEVGFFSLERVQGAKPAAPSDKPAETITRPPRPTAAATPAARAVVLFVDTLHLSTSSFMRAKKQLKQFVDEQITDQDLVAIVTTGSSLGVLQQFMRDRKTLKYAVDKVALFANSESLYTPYLAARVLSEDAGAFSAASQIMQAEEGPLPPGAEGIVKGRAAMILGEEANKRKATLLTLRAVCDRLAEMPGQRMIAFVSDGFTMLDQGGGLDNHDLIAATGRASRSGVVVYSFDARGLDVGPEYQASTAIFGSSLESVSRFALQSRNDSQDTLRTLAYDTGGEAYLNRNMLNKWLQTMLDNNTIYYAIAYYPSSNKDKKKFRNVTIRVKGHPEYSVRAQKGYFAAEEKKTEVADTPRQKLFQAMLSPLPVTAIAVTSSADFLERAGDDTQATLQVHLDGDALQYKPQDRSLVVEAEIVTTVFDQTGKLANTLAQAVKAVLSPEQAERARREGFRYNKRLTLKPGFYQLRVGVRDTGNNLMGTSMCWVEVPDLKKGKLALSSLFLGKESKKELKSDTAAAAKQAATPEFVVGRATFKIGETGFYRIVVYNAQTSNEAESKITIKVEILNSERVAYQGGWQPLASRTIRRDAKGIEAGGQLELGLAPGIYSLKVTVKDPKSKKPIERTADFEIEP